MKTTILVACSAIALIATSARAQAQTTEHTGHAGHTEQVDHAGHGAHGKHADHEEQIAVEQTKAVLAAYRDALVARDAGAMFALFRDDSVVFENGKAEGTFAQYMEHHLGPELGEIAEFSFANPTIEVRVVGHIAFAHETYSYRIALKDGRVIERDGVATSVLTHEDGAWKIVQYHSSSRAPRPN